MMGSVNGLGDNAANPCNFFCHSALNVRLLFGHRLGAFGVCCEGHPLFAKMMPFLFESCCELAPTFLCLTLKVSFNCQQLVQFAHCHLLIGSLFLLRSPDHENAA